MLDMLPPPTPLPPRLSLPAPRSAKQGVGIRAVSRVRRPLHLEAVSQDGRVLQASRQEVSFYGIIVVGYWMLFVGSLRLGNGGGRVGEEKSHLVKGGILKVVCSAHTRGLKSFTYIQTTSRF